jgi:hypothetical protein
MPEIFSNSLGLYALAGLVGAVWALAEITAGFKNETFRALGTGGAWLLIGANTAAAALTYAVAVTLFPSADTWLAALFIGLAWPTIIRNASIKVLQPLQQTGEVADESAAIRLEQIYISFQNLARQIINNTLTHQRLKLVIEAMQHDLEGLAQHARVALIASPLQEAEGMPGDNYVDRVLKRNQNDDVKKALLAAFILENFGRELLQEYLEQQRKAQKSAPPSTPLRPPAQPPAVSD